jgi:hypothetical protein
MAGNSRFSYFSLQLFPHSQNQHHGVFSENPALLGTILLAVTTKHKNLGGLKIEMYGLTDLEAGS